MSAPSVPAIDVSVIHELKELDDGAGDLLKQLVAMFVENAPVRISEIRSALERADFKKASAEAHNLKSSSGNLGAMPMARLCQAIEDCRTEGFDASVLPEALARLEAEYARARAELERAAITS